MSCSKTVISDGVQHYRLVGRDGGAQQRQRRRVWQRTQQLLLAILLLQLLEEVDVEAFRKLNIVSIYYYKISNTP